MSDSEKLQIDLDPITLARAATRAALEGLTLDEWAKKKIREGIEIESQNLKASADEPAA